jgi:hypothetical protein
VENVDNASIKIDCEKSTLTFRPKPGKSLDPSAIYAALKPIRLGKNAGSVLSYFRLTAVGPITGAKELRLSVRRRNLEFVLAATPEAKPDKGGRTLLQHVPGELAKCHGDMEVTGYLDGWKGRFPQGVVKRSAQGPGVVYWLSVNWKGSIAGLATKLGFKNLRLRCSLRGRRFQGRLPGQGERIKPSLL